MRVRERLEVLGVLVAQLGLDVVPEDGEPLAAETLDLLHLVQQQRDLLLVAVPDVQPRGDPVEEDDVVLLAALDQPLDVATLLLGVQLPPLGPVLRVVLGRVEIRVQFVLVHLPEEVEPLRHGPGPVVEPLDDPREESGLGTPGTRASIGHTAAHVTLLSSSLLEQIFVYSTTENALKIVTNQLISIIQFLFTVKCVCVLFGRRSSFAPARCLITLAGFFAEKVVCARRKENQENLLQTDG